MHVKNEELRTARELAREVTTILDALGNGDIEKIVVMRGGKIAGVLITPETYESFPLDADYRPR